MILKRKIFTSRASKVLKNKKAIEEGLKALGKESTLVTKSGKNIDLIKEIPDLKKKVLRAGRKAEKDIKISKLSRKDTGVMDRINYRAEKFTKPFKGSGSEHITLSYSKYPGNNKPERILREGHGLSKDYSLLDKIKKSIPSLK